MANNKNIISCATVRGFQVYKVSWKPKQDDLLECSHEKDNLYDSLPIKVFKPDSPAEIVGHLPTEQAESWNLSLIEEHKSQSKFVGAITEEALSFKVDLKYPVR